MKAKQIFSVVLALVMIISLSGCPQAVTPAETPTAGTVSFSPADGTEVTSGTSIVLSSETEGATIFYTTDGTDPTTESLNGTSIQLTNENPQVATVTIKAFAYCDGYNSSAITSATFTVKAKVSAVEFYEDAAFTKKIENGKYGIEGSANPQLFCKSATDGAAIQVKTTVDGTYADYTAAGYPFAPVTEKTVFTYTAKATKEGLADSAETTLVITVYPENTVFITEYYEGSSNNKYLEITNTGSSPVDLADYTLVNHNYNTSNKFNKQIPTELEGTLPAGKSAVYYNGSTALSTLTILGSLSDEVGNAEGWRKSTTFASFSGNDSISLNRGS